MKDAPEKFEVNANLATGYSALYFDRDFESFNHKAGQKLSPFERIGADVSKDYSVTADDFTYDNLRVKNSRPRSDIVGGFSFGDRYFGNRLGLIVGVSYQKYLTRISSEARIRTYITYRALRETVRKQGHIPRNKTGSERMPSLTTGSMKGTN